MLSSVPSIYIAPEYCAQAGLMSTQSQELGNVLTSVAVQKAEKVLALRKPCSAITKASLYYQHCVQRIQNTALYQPL